MKPNYSEGLEWLPDWTDPDQYPPVSGTQWAWEFLRRNPEYRDAYSKLTHVAYINNPVIGKNILLAPDHEVTEEFSRLWNITERFHLMDGLYPPDPASSRDPRLSFRASYIRSYRYSEHHPEQTVRIPPDKLLIEFDLSLPIEDQIGEAKKLLKQANATQRSKFRASNFPTYLRILDARSECVTPSFETIGQRLYPESFEPASSAAKAHKTALELRDSFFWKIPLI